MGFTRRTARRIIVFQLIGLAACVPSGDEPPAAGGESWLTDVTEGSGLDFEHTSGIDGRFFFPEILGSGGALFDYDQDGDLDVYLVQSGGNDGATPVPSELVNRLFAQEADGAFRDRTTESGAGDAGFGMGAAVGDWDNDGDLDLFVTNFGPDRLFRNDGDGTFSDVTAAAGVGGDRWSTSAGFCDYDGDGYLDLFVVTYVENDPDHGCTDLGGRPEYCAPAEYRAPADVLYRNRGDGTFEDVSERAGITAVINRGLGLACADFDGDGRADFFVANDAEPNQLWINRGDGTFVDRGTATGTAVNLFGKPEGSMGVALGDVNGDLRIDLFVTHLTRETNTLYTSLEDGVFQDSTALAGLGPGSMPYTGFGTAFFDADLDGDLDLVLVNGRVARGETAPAGPVRTDTGWSVTPEVFRSAYGEPNLLYENEGAGRFEDRCDAAVSFCSPQNVSRGLLVGDIDGDGDPDALVTDSNGPARLYRNDAPRRGNWLAVRAIDPRLQRDAIGAVVEVDTGGLRLVRLVTHTYGYLSSSDATTHFGLGEAEQVERIVVRWPGGGREAFDGTQAGRVVTVERGRGRPL